MLRTREKRGNKYQYGLQCYALAKKRGNKYQDGTTVLNMRSRKGHNSDPARRCRVRRCRVYITELVCDTAHNFAHQASTDASDHRGYIHVTRHQRTQCPRRPIFSPLPKSQRGLVGTYICTYIQRICEVVRGPPLSVNPQLRSSFSSQHSRRVSADCIQTPSL